VYERVARKHVGAGRCVVTQPWEYAPSIPGVPARLSVGTVCYGLYANPDSGNQGSIVRHGTIEGSDRHPGEDRTSTTPPRRCWPRSGWVELPRRDHWSHRLEQIVVAVLSRLSRGRRWRALAVRWHTTGRIGCAALGSSPRSLTMPPGAVRRRGT
jgi:hypothetical protein